MSIIEYTLTRSKRKTVALYIRSGGVEVRAPLKMPKREIDKFVASKEKWITKRAHDWNRYTVPLSAIYMDYEHAPIAGQGWAQEFFRLYLRIFIKTGGFYY